MKKQIIKSILLTSALFGGAQAQADIVTIEMIGTASYSYDKTGYFGTAGYGVFDGRAATVKWSIDTDLMPEEYFGGSDRYSSDFLSYAGDTGFDWEWLDVSVSLDGSSNVLDNSLVMSDPNDYSGRDFKGLSIYDKDSEYADGDLMWMNYFQELRDANGLGLEQASVYTEFQEFFDDIIIGNFPTPETALLTWNDNDPSDWGSGYFNFWNDATGFSTGASLNIYSVKADIDDGTDNLADQTAEVPVPSTLALLGLGVAGMGFLRRRKSTAA